MTKLSLIVSSLSVLLLMGCSKGPKQYQTASAPKLEVYSPSIDAEIFQDQVESNREVIGTEGASQPLYTEEDKEIAQRNSSQPIIYGIGASGITLDSPVEHIKNTLTKPLQGSERQGETQHPLESVRVKWQTLGTTILPDEIWLENNYEGSLPSDTVLGEIRIGNQYGNKLTDKNAEDVTRQLFRFFEGEDESYDCIATGECSVIRYGALGLSLPGMLLIFTNDQTSRLFRIIIRKPSLPGQLKNDVDIFDGSIQLPGGEKVRLGATWGTVKEQTQPDDVRSTRDTRNFQKIFTNIQLYTTRSKFSPQYLEPAGDEVVNKLVILPRFPKARLLNGNQIVVTVDGEQLSLELHPVGADVAENGFILQGQNDQLKGKASLQLQLMEKLGRLVSTQWQQHFAGQENILVFEPQNFGQTFKDVSRNFSSNIMYYNYSKKMGKRILFAIEESTGNLHISLELIKGDFENQVMQEMRTSFDLSKTKVAGLSLGDIVEVSDAKSIENEATLSFGGRALVVEGLAKYWSKNKDETFSERIRSELQVTLPYLQYSVVPLDSDWHTKDKYKAKVVRINFWGNQNTFSGLCGLKDFAFTTGMPIDQFESRLQEAIKKSGQGADICPYYSPIDPSGRGEVLAYFFPTNNILIVFTDNAVDPVQLVSSEGGE